MLHMFSVTNQQRFQSLVRKTGCFVKSGMPTRGHFEGQRVGPAFPLLKNALSTALQAIFWPKMH